MRSNQTPFMNKEFWTPLNYTTRLEIRFLKIKQKKASKARIKKKYARNPIEKTSDYFKYLHEKKVCDKKKMERGKSYFSNNAISNEKIGSHW